MGEAPEALPDDVETLKAALVVARAAAERAAAERDAVAAELAVAQAKTSEDLALIAHQKLRIAKLERQIYGPRSERSVRLVDQMELQLEEAEAAATEDELAARWRRPRPSRWRGSSANARRSATPSPSTCRASG